MFLRQVFDSSLSQYAYLIACQATGEAIVFDPERDVDRYLALAEEQGFRIVAAAETHIHADFLSGTRELAERVGCHLYLSDEGAEQGWPSAWAKDTRYATTFLKDGDVFKIGNITFTVLKTPGHTPEHIAYLVTDAKARSPMGIITGDFLFVGDLGRPDLLEKAAKIDNTAEASAKALFSSAQNLLGWGDRDHLLVWPAHGAGSACGKGLGAVPHSSLGYERLQNPALAKVREGQKAFVDHILSGQPEPPLYFARMKALNRDGVPLLPKLPEPRRLSVQELGTVIEEGRLLPVDAREAKLDFLSRHLPGSLFAPFSSNFSTVVGSLVEDPSAPILLVIESDHEEEAIRRLVRIGYDQIEAVVHLDTLARYFFEGGKSASIPTIDFAQAEQLRKKGAAVVDLRFKHEYDSGHVPGAIHAPYTRLPELLKDIPASSQIVAHCHAGLRAAVSSAYLQRKGFKVSAVNDHIDHYKEIRD